MSVEVISSVLRHSRARLSARLVLLVLADGSHADGITYDGQDLIAAKCLLSLAEVKRSIEELERIGEVEKRKAQRGRKRINVYRVALPGVADPMYDRLPFSVSEPFTTTVAQVEPPSENDDGSSGQTTTAHLVKPRARSLLGPVNQDPSSAIALGAREPEWPPPLPPVALNPEGRNLPLDALVDECGIDPAGRRLTVAAIHLNGRSGRKAPDGRAELGIRDLFWLECIRAAEERGRHAELAAMTAEQFAGLLVERIHLKAALFRERMPNVTLGPKGRADHWLDLTRASAAGGAPRRMSREEFIRIALEDDQ
jgi:hypothetical protein